jgi:hypothetical protein
MMQIMSSKKTKKKIIPALLRMFFANFDEFPTTVARRAAHRSATSRILMVALHRDTRNSSRVAALIFMAGWGLRSQAPIKRILHGFPLSFLMCC